MLSTHITPCCCSTGSGHPQSYPSGKRVFERPQNIPNSWPMHRRFQHQRQTLHQIQTCNLWFEFDHNTNVYDFRYVWGESCFEQFGLDIFCILCFFVIRTQDWYLYLTFLWFVLFNLLDMLPTQSRFIHATLLHPKLSTEPRFVIFLRIMFFNLFYMIPSQSRLQIWNLILWVKWTMYIRATNIWNHDI